MPHWVFVWTISDIIGAAFVGLIILLGLAYAILVVLDKMQRKWRAFTNNASK